MVDAALLAKLHARRPDPPTECLYQCTVTMR